MGCECRCWFGSHAARSIRVGKTFVLASQSLKLELKVHTPSKSPCHSSLWLQFYGWMIWVASDRLWKCSEPGFRVECRVITPQVRRHVLVGLDRKPWAVSRVLKAPSSLPLGFSPLSLLSFPLSQMQTSANCTQRHSSNLHLMSLAQVDVVATNMLVGTWCQKSESYTQSTRFVQICAVP